MTTRPPCPTPDLTDLTDLHDPADTDAITDATIDTITDDIAAMGPDAVIARSEAELAAALQDLPPRRDKPRK